MKSSLIGRGEGVLKSGEGSCPSVIEESRLRKVRRDSRKHYNSLGRLLASCVVFSNIGRDERERLGPTMLPRRTHSLSGSGMACYRHYYFLWGHTTRRAMGTADRSRGLHHDSIILLDGEG